MTSDEFKNLLSLVTHHLSLVAAFLMQAKKRFGQNFLVDERVIERIVRALEPREGETVVEIGAGRGALTSRLVERAGRLVAIEFDRDLVPLLRRQFAGRGNFELIEGDALALDFCSLVAPATSARVVANLPYYISTAILQHLITQRRCLTEMVLMLQREVVERITAQPSTSERGFLSVLVQAYCDIETLFDVAPASFRPVPKVWSTVIRLNLREKLPFEVEDEALLWQLVSAGFAQRRKTLSNNLKSAGASLRSSIDEAGGPSELLAASQVEPQRRAETLTLEEWSRLISALHTLRRD